MKHLIIYGTLLIVVALIVSTYIFPKNKVVAATPQARVARGNGVVASKNPALVSASLNDAQDVVPGRYPNLINNTATATGLDIVSGLVENNLDGNGKVTDDHLELLLKNNSTKSMTDFEAYYTITDTINGNKEGYYKKLTGLSIAPGMSASVHFDGKNDHLHYGVNKDGIYFTSKNKLQFDVEISTPGFKTQRLQVAKDAGGAEVKD